ncbi:hypothetical protein IKG05_01980 [Candidatus Saccharibacteria bacterium]|nr:hypothetical protein [Candidatus Saccharibacteria bacterium]
MAQAKRKTSTKTKKSSTQQRQTGSRANTRTSKKQQGISNQERMHVYIVTAMAIVAGILLCANAAMMMV